MRSSSHPNEWVSSEHALQYLARADSVPHRGEGEAVLLEFVPMDVGRILDLGTGDGRLLALLRAARERFRDDGKVQVLQHDLEERLPDLGRFDVIVSSLAIHHVSDMRKKALYSEIHASLCPGGVFCNLEHVAPVSGELHRRFLEALGTAEAEEDPSNQLVSAEI